MTADSILIDAVMLLANWVDAMALDAWGGPTSETEKQAKQLIAAYEGVLKWYA